MAIPAITPYALPAEHELPANRVGWTPDPTRLVLLIHDMQNYFLRAFPAGQAPLPALVTNIRAIRRRCHELGVPVVYSAQPGGQTAAQRGLQLDMWGDGVGADPVDARIVDELAPTDGDLLMVKWRYNAFHRTGLAELFADTGRDQLAVTGIYAHIGCLMTACDAFMRDIQAFFVADAVADFSAEYHRMAVRYAAQRCAVTLPTRTLLAGLATGQDQAVPSISRRAVR